MARTGPVDPKKSQPWGPFHEIVLGEQVAAA